MGSRSSRFWPRTMWWSDRLARRGERLSGSSGSSVATSSIDPVGGGDQLWDRHGRVAQDDEQRPLAVLAQVQCRLEDPQREAAGAGRADGLAPGGELGRDVEQPPARVAEGERQRPAGEDLDLLRGGQHQADVPARVRRLGVAGVGARARDRRAGSVPAPARPSASMSTARIRSPWRSTRKTVRTPSQSRWNPLIAVSRVLNRGAPSGFTQAGAAGSCAECQQQRPHRDPAVLVGRQRRDPQRLQRRRDPERVVGVQVIGDDQVFEDVVEPLQPVRDVRVEQAPEPQVERLQRSSRSAAARAGRNGVGLPGWKTYRVPNHSITTPRPSGSSVSR